MVKIWEERRDVQGAPSTWRGSVDDVQRGGRTYFSSLLDLCAYLSQRSGMVGCTPETADHLAPRPRRRARKEQV